MSENEVGHAISARTLLSDLMCFLGASDSQYSVELALILLSPNMVTHSITLRSPHDSLTLHSLRFKKAVALSLRPPSALWRGGTPS